MSSDAVPGQHSVLFTSLCNLAILVCFTIGLVGLCGWHFGLESLLHTELKREPITYTTSLCFLLVAFSLWSHCLNFRKLSFALASIVAVINLLVLCENAFGIGPELEAIFLTSTDSIKAQVSLLESSFTAFGFLLCYAAYLTGRKISHPIGGVILLILGAALLTIGLVSFVGYAIDAQLDYSRGSFLNIAPHASMGFIFLGILIMFSSLERETHYWLPSLLTLAGLTLTTSAFAFVLFSDRRTLAATFQLDAQNVSLNLKEELKFKTAVVGAVRAFFDSSREVERGEFSIFVNSLLEHHPGIQALEWVPVVTRNERTALEESARADGVLDFQIRELAENGELRISKDKDFYYPIYFREPQKDNDKVLGFDLSSEPVRYAAIQEARDSGEMIASPIVKLAQDPVLFPSIFVVYPVYKKGSQTESVEWRRANIEGWVVAVFKIGALFQNITSRIDLSQIGLRVYQGGEANEDALLFSLGETTAPPPTITEELADQYTEHSLTYLAAIEILRQNWLLVLTPSKSYVKSRGSWMPWIILAGGTGSTIFLLALLIHFVLSRKNISIAKAQLERENIERRRAEESLVSERERLNVTLRSIGDGVIATEADGRIVLINPVAEALTSWSEKEAIGKNLIDVLKLLDSDNPEQDATVHLFAHAQRGAASGESILQARDKTRKIVAHSVAPIRDPRGKPLGTVLVMRDITQAKQSESDLLRAQKLESVGVLAGGIAHDFNNILSGIMGSISLARSIGDGSSEVQPLLTTAEKACLRARSLTQQLLTFSKGGAPVKKVIKVEELIHDAVGLALGGSDVACTFNIENALSAVEADEGQLVQVINNLVINAEQATPGSGTIEIEAYNQYVHNGEIPVLSEGRYVVISIRDHGVGIPAESLTRIFDPYYTTKGTGTGLGLTAVHSIIRNHGGHVSVSSELGKGSRFTIYLPACNGVVSSETTKVIEFPSGEGRVMVVDDESLILDVAQEMLQRLGYHVSTATGGEEALNLYRESMHNGQKFDAVILDLTIPGDLGGKEIARLLLSVDPDARIIVSSGYSNDKVVSDYRAFGFCQVLSKPYGIDSLGRVLREVISAGQVELRSVNS